MTRILPIVLALAAAMFGPSICASEPESFGREILWHGDRPDIDARIAAATYLLSLARDYDGNTPVLKPEERQYVVDEMRNLSQHPSGERATQFLNSREYKILRARQELQPLISHLEMISEQQLDVHTDEVKAWARVAYSLLSTEIYDVHDHLQRSRELSQRPQILSTGKFYGLQILRLMVMHQL